MLPSCTAVYKTHQISNCKFNRKLEKEQHRSVIRFLFLDGQMCEEIKAKLHAACGD